MRRFWSDPKGNVAVLFALAVIPLFGAMGAAVDYSMANAFRSDMQKAVDATALALAKIMPASQQTLNTKALQYFQASMGNHSLANVVVSVSTDTGFVRVNAHGMYTPKMASVMGIGNFEIGARADARWSIGKLEIALVLDNSGSMASMNRMTHLKAATHNLLKSLSSAVKQPGDGKVAIVPFDTRVNVGTANVNAPWLRWTEWDAQNGSEQEENCAGNKGKGKGGGKCDTVWVPNDHKTWTGCVWDRDKNYDVQDTAPTNAATQYPAWQCESSLTSIMPLTENWNALHAKVDAMQPAGWTNIAIGMAWGLHALSPTPVLTEGAAYNTPYLTKYIILMTDGDNTKNRFGDSANVMNQRTEAACSAAKAAGIRIYSVRLVEGNANLIRNCASDPSMYYDVQNAAQLSAVFNAITSEMVKLHLAK